MSEAAGEKLNRLQEWEVCSECGADDDANVTDVTNCKRTVNDKSKRYDGGKDNAWVCARSLDLWKAYPLWYGILEA